MLSRLLPPLRSSLFHCRTSLSKLWHSTILDPGFQKSEPADESVFVVAGRDDYRMIDKAGTTKPHIPPWSTDESLEKMVITMQVSNSCNGMMLIPYKNSFFLFNPETQYFQKVLQLDCPNLEYSCLGLCYDRSVDDYKALLLISSSKFVAQASLKGKQWTRVDFPFSSYNVEQGPVLNGRLHWIYRSNDEKNNIILSFNPISNVFEKLSGPPSQPGCPSIIMGLAVMDGCLWLTRWSVVEPGFKTREIEVFKMKEYGLPESWTLMFSLTNVRLHLAGDDGVTPLIMTESGQVLFSKDWAYNTNHGELLAYNPETKWCLTHCVTPSFYPQSVSFVKNSASPVGYLWDPIQHERFGRFE